MNKKILLLFSAMLLLSGCRMIVLKMYGIKNPEVENEKHILKKAHK
ncbi:MAG: lipoprotein [Bacteroidia bacterium]|nr:lipoprotein [Bacteroidia bacterium]